MSALEAFVKTMGNARRRALIDKRQEERVAQERGDEVLGVQEVAAALELNFEVVRRRMTKGLIRGAYLEKNRWCLRRVDLWRQLASGRSDDGEVA